MSTLTDQRTAALAHATELYAGGASATVLAALDMFGEWMPELAARNIVAQHGLDVNETLNEVYWGGPLDASGGSTKVHTCHLFLVLGY